MQENNDLNYNFDIDQIMQTIRQEIKEKNLDHVILDFEEIPFQQEIRHTDSNPFQIDSLQQSMEYLSIRSQIDPYKQPIEGNFLVKFVKKVLRKLMKFYMMPIITEQNA
ncbi:MAG: hypothetical protein K2H82_09570 [Oscillospiraceae bacterium]|nr:hypothetical protein [Oscillospiraceae bacterium]